MSLSSRHFVALLQEELESYPGRLSGSMRDTLGMVLAVVLAMTLRVPGISLSAALLLLMQRERPGLTLRVGLQILVGCIAAAAVSLFWVQITDGSEVARFLGGIIGVFVAAFCMAGSSMPLLWTIFGFYGFVDMAFWDGHHSADAGVRYCLNNIASLALVLICATAVEYLFGTRHPAEDLDDEMNKRIQVLERFFSALAEGKKETHPQEFRGAHQQLLQSAHAGDYHLNELYDRLRDSSRSLSQVPVGLQYRIGLLTRVMRKSIFFGFSSIHNYEVLAHRAAYQAIADLCQTILKKETIQTSSLPSHSSALLREIFSELQQYADVSHTAETPSEQLRTTERKVLRPQFFLPGVFQQADVVLYALKLTLSATICYVFYNAVAWPGILTCVVTVLFTGLNTTGAMKQKQIYRFLGAAIGGILGIFAVSVLFPNMDSITSLVILIAPVAFLSGWIMRSPRIGYVGVQIAFAFFITTLPGFGPATSISPARDRVIGIALGIGVMWLIFDQLWPTRTSDALQKTLKEIRSATQRLRIGLADTSARPDFERLRTLVSLELTNVQQLDFAAQFEIGRHRTRELVTTRRLMRSIEAAAAEFYQEAAKEPQLS